MNLFEIDYEIMKCIDDETGEIIDSEKLDSLQMEQDKKIENICLWIKNLKSDAEQLKEQKNIFAEREKSAKNKAESLKKYLDSFMNGQTFSSTLAKVSYRKSESVNVLDVSQIPEEYLKVQNPAADLTKIKKALKGGNEIAGAELIEKQNIQIK